MGMGAIGLVGTLASTGLAIYGQNQQAKATMRAARYNDTLAENEARNDEAETRVGIQRKRVANREALAAMRVQSAFSGVRTDTGSALIAGGEAAGRMEMEIQDAARASAMRTASVRAKGKMGLWEAAQVKKATRLQMLATGIQGATSAFGQYQSGRQTGIY